MTKFKIRLQIKFLKTFDIRDFRAQYGFEEPVPEDEPIPTIEEIDEFMTSKTRYGEIRYKDYIKNIYNYTTCVQVLDENIQYLNNGIIEYIIPRTESPNDYEPSFTNPKEIEEHLRSDSLEDGLFQCQSLSAFPFRKSLLNGSPVEMGILDYRCNPILIEKIPTNKK